MGVDRLNCHFELIEPPLHLSAFECVIVERRQLTTSYGIVIESLVLGVTVYDRKSASGPGGKGKVK